MTSNALNNSDTAFAEVGPKGEDAESLAEILDSCPVEALKMVLMILRAQQNTTGPGT